MKFLTKIILLILVSNTVLGNLYIEKVYYDPAQTESGGEAIQLYNYGTADVYLKGWVIETESSKRDVVLSDTTIKAKSYFLIADTGWSEKKDNLVREAESCVNGFYC